MNACQSNFLAAAQNTPICGHDVTVYSLVFEEHIVNLEQ